VTVHGGKPRKMATASADLSALPDLPEPALPAIDTTYNIIVTGIGGTGVVTIGAILGMAAHLEGKGMGMIDMAGLAQKGGAVFSHVKLANRQEDVQSIRVTAGMADLVLGCDLVVTGTKKVLAAVKAGRTALVVNTAEVMPGDFTRNADFSLPAERVKRAILSAAGGEGGAGAGREAATFVNATVIATALLGNALAANMFVLGCAWQRGRVPLSRAAIRRAIELNGEAVKMNLDAFEWGRRSAADPDAVMALLPSPEGPAASRDISQTLDEEIERRVVFLTDYQSKRYAERYRKAVERTREAEGRAVPGQTTLTAAVARSLFKLMAYKDEYEVARLYTDGSFADQMARTFEGENLRLEFHLAPPLFAKTDPKTGVPRKMSFGPWMMRAFSLLAKGRRLRGTPLDPFGYTHERRVERQLVRDYEAMLGEILSGLSAANHVTAVGLASIPAKSAASGTSRRVISRRPSVRRRTCWSASARRSRRWRKPRNSSTPLLPTREKVARLGSLQPSSDLDDEATFSRTGRRRAPPRPPGGPCRVRRRVGWPLHVGWTAPSRPRGPRGSS
jgi:indolepyruvate ferredoxin oxidoreductase